MLLLLPRQQKKKKNKKGFNIDNEVHCMGAHPLSSALSQRAFNKG